LCIQTFAIKFADSEGAKEFEAAFKAGQAEMVKVLAGEDSKEGKAEADAAAAAIDSLTVGKAEGENSENKTAETEASK
jgi:hypothetical protein